MKKITKFSLVFILMLVIVYIGFTSPNKNNMQLSYVREPYLYEQLPLLTEDSVKQIVSEYKIDDIKQVFYSQENSKNCYCYLEIAGKKYDMGVTFKDRLLVDNRIIKTTIKHTQTIYKQVKINGNNDTVSDYIVINDNIPEILYTIDNCEEFKNMNEVMSISAHDIITKTIIYRWTDKEICIYDLNKHFKADFVRVDTDSSLIEVIEKCTDSDYMTREKVLYKLKGIIVNKI